MKNNYSYFYFSSFYCYYYSLNRCFCFVASSTSKPKTHHSLVEAGFESSLTLSAPVESMMLGIVLGTVPITVFGSLAAKALFEGFNCFCSQFSLDVLWFFINCIGHLVLCLRLFHVVVLCCFIFSLCVLSDKLESELTFAQSCS